MCSSFFSKRISRLSVLLLSLFCLILLRVWFLSVVQHQHYSEKARKPQVRTIIEPACRGTIRDRFGLPFAINRVQYDVAVCYDSIRKIPAISWKSLPKGRKVKVHERETHVHNLATFLADKLNKEVEQIKDIIYSKAALFPHVPFTLAENISEALYYQLRFIEDRWPGLETQRVSRRDYPQEKTAGAIIGFLGEIDQPLYERIAHEKHQLEQYLEELEGDFPSPLPKGFLSTQEVRNRLQQLRDMAYTFCTKVGRSGLEKRFEEALRGEVGKRSIEVGARGQFLRHCPIAHKPIAGQSIQLTLSAELQKFSEQLLVESEYERGAGLSFHSRNHLSAPWIKGGAIVAMTPHSGEIVALASHPNLNPNDFIRRDPFMIYQWLEHPTYRMEIWDGLRPLTREFPEGSDSLHPDQEGECFLSWPLFLDMVLSKKSQVRKQCQNIISLSQAQRIKDRMREWLTSWERGEAATWINLLYSETERHVPSARGSKDKNRALFISSMAAYARQQLDPVFLPIRYNEDKLLLLDLLCLGTNGKDFSEGLLQQIGGLSIAEYRQLTQEVVTLKKWSKEEVKALYHALIFPTWRKEHFPSYLKQKREEEKRRKSYGRPYLDYLTQVEKTHFSLFWRTHREDILAYLLFNQQPVKGDLAPFLLHFSSKRPALQAQFRHLVERCYSLDEDHRFEFLSTMCSCKGLKAPLWGHYPWLNRHLIPRLKDLALAFYPKYGFGFGRSYAYQHATAPGSIFKLVTAYEALKQLSLSSRREPERVEEEPPLPTITDLSSSRKIAHPNVILGTTFDGHTVRGMYRGGRLPRSYKPLGNLDFYRAVAQSSNLYFALLAGDIVEDPFDLYRTTKQFGYGARTQIDLPGEIAGSVPDDIRYDRSGLYAFAIGQHSLMVTPLQCAVMLSTFANYGEKPIPHIVKPWSNPSRTHAHFSPYRAEKDVFPMPHRVRVHLLESMRQVMWSNYGLAHPNKIHAWAKHPQWLKDYQSLKNQCVGKTSTAEMPYHPHLNRDCPPLVIKDTGFGAISFCTSEKKSIDQATPELIVVVCLKHGQAGNEAAPLAAQVIKKWRDICTSWENPSYTPSKVVANREARSCPPFPLPYY